MDKNSCGRVTKRASFLARGPLFSALAAGALVVGVLDLAGCPGPDPRALDASPGNGGSSSASLTTTANTGGGQASVAASSGSLGGGGMGGMSATSVTSSISSSSIGTGGSGGGCGILTLCGANCVDLGSDVQNCGGCGRFCSTNETDMVSCQSGLCTSTCQPGYFNVSMPPAPQDDNGCEAAGKRVFVSKATVATVWGSAQNGDMNCQTYAINQNLSGTWMAWLSDGQSSPKTRFSQLGPYVGMDGNLIANDWAKLTSGTLSGGISKDETGGIVNDSFAVWTGTLPTGTADSSGHCLDWASSFNDPQDTPAVGMFGLTSAAWTDAKPQTCDQVGHLYCFEQ